jgi:hypothetical protein
MWKYAELIGDTHEPFCFFTFFDVVSVNFNLNNSDLQERQVALLWRIIIEDEPFWYNSYVSIVVVIVSTCLEKTE